VEVIVFVDRGCQELEAAGKGAVVQCSGAAPFASLGHFFKLLTFVYLFGALALVLPVLDLKSTSTTTAHTALIEIRGMIADREEASADKVVGSLRAAFEDANTKGVILRINSPGGSPVQSGSPTAHREAETAKAHRG